MHQRLPLHIPIPQYLQDLYPNTCYKTIPLSSIGVIELLGGIIDIRDWSKQIVYKESKLTRRQFLMALADVRRTNPEAVPFVKEGMAHCRNFFRLHVPTVTGSHEECKYTKWRL